MSTIWARKHVPPPLECMFIGYLVVAKIKAVFIRQFELARETTLSRKSANPCGNPGSLFSTTGQSLKALRGMLAETSFTSVFRFMDRP